MRNGKQECYQTDPKWKLVSFSFYYYYYYKHCIDKWNNPKSKIRVNNQKGQIISLVPKLSSLYQIGSKTLKGFY